MPFAACLQCTQYRLRSVWRGLSAEAPPSKLDGLLSELRKQINLRSRCSNPPNVS